MDFVSIIMGSKSDFSVMSECAEVFKKFDVPYEMIVSSAHRSPERTKEYIKDAQSRGAQVFIAAMPVATVTIGKAGAINAAYLAIQILSLKNDELAGKLVQDRMMKAKKVELDSSEIEVRID